MENIKYTCLFGGGAIRGVSYIGAIKAFEELQISMDTLGGSSAGSVFAALLAVGYNSDELKELFTQVNFNLFKDISIGFGPIFAFSKGEVFLDWIREIIEKKYYGDNYKKGANRAVTFKDLEKNLIIITTDLANFECKEFSKEETPDYEIASAIRISCCMPGLMKPIEYNNTLLVDGDLQKSKPMWKLAKSLKNSPDRILELRLEGYYENDDISGIDYANAVYSCFTAISTSFITEIYANNDKYDYLVLNTGETVIVDFNIGEDKRNQLIQTGYEQTMKFFKRTLKDKKIKIKNCYEGIYKHIVKVENLIDAENHTRAKLELGELFMDMYSPSPIIEINILNQINKFKNLFIENLKYPTIFGKIKLKNEELVHAELKDLISKVKEKIDDINSYLNNNLIIDNT